MTLTRIGRFGGGIGGGGTFKKQLTLLPTGRVLVAGGVARDHAIAVTQEFDPATGRWHRKNDLPAPLCDQIGALLTGGRVLLAGGATKWVPVHTTGTPDLTRRALVYGP